MEWEAVDVLDPIGEQRADYRTAQLCCTIDNIAKAIWGKKGANKFSKISDFIPKWGSEEEVKETKKQTTEEMKAIMFGLQRHMNDQRNK